MHLLSGYRGAGKTTELLRLCGGLDPEAYVPVYWDVEDYFNTELPLEEGAVLVGLAAGSVDSCEGIDIPKERLSSKLTRFLERIDVEAGLNVVTGPAALDVKAALRDDESFRQKVKNALVSNRRRFKEEVHSFFEAVVESMPGGKTPVFIVDSIDHFRGRASSFDEVRESVESLSSVCASELTLPRMHVVYTVPVYARPAGWDGQVWPVLNVKVRQRDGSDRREGIDLLRKVLVRRAPDGDLERLLGGEIDRVIRASGGRRVVLAPSRQRRVLPQRRGGLVRCSPCAGPAAEGAALTCSRVRSSPRTGLTRCGPTSVTTWNGRGVKEWLCSSAWRLAVVPRP